jgi:hypothetical protein
MIGRSIKALIVALGVLLIAYPAGEYARETTKILTFWHSGQLYSDVRQATADAPMVFTRVDTLDFAGRTASRARRPATVQPWCCGPPAPALCSSSAAGTCCGC